MTHRCMRPILIAVALTFASVLRDNLDENGSGSRSVKRRSVAKR
jgi:hypothetical protein